MGVAKCKSAVTETSTYLAGIVLFFKSSLSHTLQFYLKTNGQ